MTHSPSARSAELFAEPPFSHWTTTRLATWIAIHCEFSHIYIRGYAAKIANIFQSHKIQTHNLFTLSDRARLDRTDLLALRQAGPCFARLVAWLRTCVCLAECLNNLNDFNDTMININGKHKSAEVGIEGLHTKPYLQLVGPQSSVECRQHQIHSHRCRYMGRYVDGPDRLASPQRANCMWTDIDV